MTGGFPAPPLRRTKGVVCAFATAVALAACTGGSAAPEPPPDGAALFQMACARCHGPAGRGDGPLAARDGPIPDLNARDLGDRYARRDLEELVRYGRGKMPGHRERLGAVELSVVLDHVESRFMRRAPTPALSPSAPGSGP